MKMFFALHILPKKFDRSSVTVKCDDFIIRKTQNYLSRPKQFSFYYVLVCSARTECSSLLLANEAIELDSICVLEICINSQL